jgi:choline kinase
MKVRYDGLRLTAIAKNLDPASCNGEYIGVARFDPPGARAFFRHASAILARGGEEEWYEAAIEGAAREVPFGLRSTAGLPWIEIDDFDDLRRAELEVLPLIPR